MIPHWSSRGGEGVPGRGYDASEEFQGEDMTHQKVPDEKGLLFSITWSIIAWIGIYKSVVLSENVDLIKIWAENKH